MWNVIKGFSFCRVSVCLHVVASCTLPNVHSTTIKRPTAFSDLFSKPHAPSPPYTFPFSSCLPVLQCTLFHPPLRRPHYCFLSRSHFSPPDLFPSHFFPPHYIFPRQLIYACFIQLFFTYSSGVTFFSSEGTHFFLSSRLVLSMWVIVQSCGVLKTWGDCQTDQ